MKKQIIFIIFFSFFTYKSSAMNKARTQKPSGHKTLIFTAAALITTGYLGYQWFKRPQKLNVTEENIKLTILNQNKNNNPTVVSIFSHGLDLRKDVHKMQAQMYIDNNIITGPCITFNYNDSPRTFNFGQEQDIACLKTAYNFTRKKYPEAKIMLVGLSRGASTILNLLSQEELENIQGIILESPFSDIKTMTNHIAQCYLKYIPYSKTMLYNLVCSLPNYKSNGVHSIDTIKKIKTNVPMLVICSKGDKVVPAQQTEKLANALKKEGKQVELIVVEQGNHSKQTFNKFVQKQAQKFLHSLD